MKENTVNAGNSEKRPINITALVLGILSIVFIWFFPLAILLGIIAIIVGFVGKSRGLPGIICGFIGLLTPIFVIGTFVVILLTSEDAMQAWGKFIQQYQDEIQQIEDRSDRLEDSFGD